MFLNQAMFADKIGVSRDWVSQVEREKVKSVHRRVVGEVADALQMKPEDLLAERKISTDPMGPGESFKLVKTRKYPVFAVTIPAGEWADSEPKAIDGADGWVLLDPATTPIDAFALQITGDCMEPEFASGSTIVFAPIRDGEEGAKPLRQGEPCYFEHSDEKSTFKSVFYEPEHERYRLQPVNKKYSPIYVPAQMKARISRAIKVVRNIG